MILHTCNHCGCQQDKRAFWRHVINNDEGLKNISQEKRDMFLDYVMFVGYENK
jgi:hypothetical protein